MSTQAKTTARTFFEEQDRLRGGPSAALCATGYAARIGSFPPMDFAGHEAFATAFYAAFPDLRHVIEEVIAEGDRATVSFRLQGTHTGSFMGQPPSDRPIDVACLALMNISSGKVISLHGEFDRLAMMQQIGALPSD